LITVFFVWILIIGFGFVPKSIEPLKIDLSNSPITVEALKSIVFVYFWVSFIVYAFQN
jgi:hypothetical protein